MVVLYYRLAGPREFVIDLAAHSMLLVENTIRQYMTVAARPTKDKKKTKISFLWIILFV